MDLRDVVKKLTEKWPRSLAMGISSRLFKCLCLLVLALMSRSRSPVAMVQRVLVTGGNKGIGRALCRQLAADHGFHVLLGSRDERRGQEAVKAILEQSPDCRADAERLS